MLDPLIGTRVGNYQVLGLLGEGGMARVYRATHPEIGREVAVKVLSNEVAAMPDVVRRFRVEAQIVNKIDHPNIIKIFDFGTLPDGRPFYLMELLAGESLADRIAHGGAMSLHEALTITDAVLDALDAVHRANIVHRDLKPDNVFLVQSGGHRIVKLLDFGIVKLLGEMAFDKTRTGSLLGTPSYMSPEQCEGRVKDIDARTDIYAVGCILYQMLSGELPFNAESLGGLLLQHMTVTPRPLTDRIRGLPLALSQLVQQCLAKFPHERPPSASWLRQQLRPFVAQGPALSAAETIAAMAPQAPYAVQTLPSQSGPLVPSPPSPASNPSPIPIESRTMPMSSIPTPQPSTAHQRKRWPIIAGVGVVAAAGIAAAIVMATRSNRAATAAADARAPDVAETAAQPPQDAAPPPDAAIDAPVDATVSDAPPDGPLTLKERLEALKRMCDDGLFDAAECKAKHKQLMREWDNEAR